VSGSVLLDGRARFIGMTSTLTRSAPIPTEGERLILEPRLLARFMSKIKKIQVLEDPAEGECWVWMPPSQNGGYGRFYLGRDDEGKQHYKGSHVISYMQSVGPVPIGWVVDHMCNNKACCAPYHLEAVKNLENLRRAHERRPWRRLNQYGADFTNDPETDWRLAL
jgi:hypothetical protein